MGAFYDTIIQYSWCIAIIIALLVVVLGYHGLPLWCWTLFIGAVLCGVGASYPVILSTAATKRGVTAIPTAVSAGHFTSLTSLSASIADTARVTVPRFTS